MHSLITILEGILIGVYSIGIIFLLIPIKFKVIFFDIVRSIFVMLQVPLSIIMVPFFIYTSAVLLFGRYWLGEESDETKLRNYHIVYGLCFIAFIIFWITISIMYKRPE
jgi:hypothetical protein